MNYSLLRPFDLEAAKRGDLLIDYYGTEYTFIAEAGPDGDHAIRRKSDGNVFADRASALCMAPLAWVEDKPVYPGAVLWYKRDKFSIEVVGRNHFTGTGIRGVVKECLPGSLYSSGEDTWAEPVSWTWERPKVPLAWVEDKPVYPGDVLYWSGRLGVESGAKFTARSSGGGFIRGETLFADGIRIAYEQSEGMLPESLTWTPPKQKKEMWVNVYSTGDGCGHPTKEVADQLAFRDRITCVRLEYEV